jgi:hypothetical protein
VPQKASAPKISLNKAPPPITGFDRRTEQKLTRGNVEIESRLEEKTWKDDGEQQITCKPWRIHRAEGTDDHTRDHQCGGVWDLQPARSDGSGGCHGEQDYQRRFNRHGLSARQSDWRWHGQ